MKRLADLTAATPPTRLLDKAVGAIERAALIDTIAAPLVAAEKKLGQTLPWWKNLMSGTFLGHPLHPLLVAVPIGSWTAATVFDLVGDCEGARRLVGFGVVSALPSMASGGSDWAYTAGAEQRVGFVHASANGLAVTAYALSWWQRRRGHAAAGIGWSIIGGSCLTVAGWLGGHLAYALGVGVDTTAFQRSELEWTPVAASDQVKRGQLTAADVHGVPIVLTRSGGGRLVALADRCTHRGGPLHDGELEAGCLVCPWHGSAFDLDGAVVRGPATRPQLAYEVAERDGQVLVRIPDEPRTLRTNPVGR